MQAKESVGELRNDMNNNESDTNEWCNIGTKLSLAASDSIRVCNNVLYDEADHKYWQSFEDIDVASTRVDQRILGIVSTLIAFIEPDTDTSLFTTTTTTTTTTRSVTHHHHATAATGDVDDQYRVVVDALDTSYEMTRVALDAVKSIHGEGDSSLSENTRVKELAKNAMHCATYGSRQSKLIVSRTSAIRANTNAMMVKPQLAFKTLVDNSMDNVFIPVLREKPNAITPLPDYTLITNTKALTHSSLTSSSSSSSHVSWPHPYASELQALEFSDEQQARCNEQLFASLGDTSCRWIDTVDELDELCTLLCQQKEFAIDVEHHNVRSYLGITCLMQISTRDADFLLDTLALRDVLYRLNTSFTHHCIVKVIHGADHDILWLQRDLGLYVVNMFDTGQAARLLQLARFSLAFLLHHYCDVHVDKSYQLADWRQRPLSAEMLRYARMDTHYLLYVYDRLRNELVQTSRASSMDNLILQVLERSRRICLQVYEKPIFSAFAHKSFISRSKVKLNSDQMKVFAALFAWRDKIARTEDESCAYVMTKRTLIAIAQAMPRDRASLFAACRTISCIAREHADNIVTTIQHALTEATNTNTVLSPTCEVSAQHHNASEHIRFTTHTTPVDDENTRVTNINGDEDNVCDNNDDDDDDDDAHTLVAVAKTCRIRATKSEATTSDDKQSMFSQHTAFMLSESSDDDNDDEDQTEALKRVALIQAELSRCAPGGIQHVDIPQVPIPITKTSSSSCSNDDDDDDDESIIDSDHIDQAAHSLTQIQAMTTAYRRRNHQNQKYQNKVCNGDELTAMIDKDASKPRTESTAAQRAQSLMHQTAVELAGDDDDDDDDECQITLSSKHSAKSRAKRRNKKRRHNATAAQCAAAMKPFDFEQANNELNEMARSNVIEATPFNPYANNTHHSDKRERGSSRARTRGRRGRARKA